MAMRNGTPGECADAINGRTGKRSKSGWSWGSSDYSDSARRIWRPGGPAWRAAPNVS